MRFSGRTLSPGLGEGKTFVYRDVLSRLDEVYDIEESQVKEELSRFNLVVERITDELSDLVGSVKQEMDANLSAVFDAHIIILQDPSLKTEVENEVSNEMISAGSAVRTVFRRWERRFRSMEAEVARQKADDVHDLARQLISSLAGIRGHALEDLPIGSVLVAARLLPSDTIFLAHRKASAALVEVGGPASHAALFAREIGLPCLTGIKNILETVPANTYALVDAESAEAIVNPKQAQKRLFQAKRERSRHASVAAQAHSHESAVRRDGKVISVLANIGCQDDTLRAIKNGADGVGLYRIEQVYLQRQAPLETIVLVEEMTRVLSPAKDLPVCVRMLDVGADKPLPCMESAHEANPCLGRRGIRFLLEYPDLLQTQLSALLQLSSEFDLSILVPMVTLPRDIITVRKHLITVRKHLNEIAQQSRINTLPKLGAMIETPAAALSARELAQHADFLSFGTNDLTQYIFAAYRENAAVDGYFLLKTAHDDAPDVPLSICGELASRPEHSAKIMQCGITSLSVAPPLIPKIKEAVRQS